MNRHSAQLNELVHEYKRRLARNSTRKSWKCHASCVQKRSKESFVRISVMDVRFQERRHLQRNNGQKQLIDIDGVDWEEAIKLWWMGCCCFSSYLRVPYFPVLSSPFSILFSTHGRLISIAVPVFSSCLLLERLQQVLMFCEQRHAPGLRLHTWIPWGYWICQSQVPELLEKQNLEGSSALL